MSDTSKDFQEARERYRPLLERALLYFLEDEDEDAARRVASSALEQANRQWIALEGEANLLHVIGMAAEDQCKLLLTRSIFVRRKPNPTAVQIIRHMEWYDWEQRIESLRTAIEVKRASERESGTGVRGDAEIGALNRSLNEIIQLLFSSKLGLTDEDENAGGGVACPLPDPTPARGPGTQRTYWEAIEAPRNP